MQRPMSANHEIAAVLFFFAIVVCVELGYRIGESRRSHTVDGDFGGIRGAVLSVVALLLGFSFSLAVSHYDARRGVVVKEANAIGTTMLRSELLSAPAADAMRRLGADYIEARLEYVSAPDDAATKVRAAGRTADLQRRMWAVARAETRRDPRSTVVPLFVSSLNETIDVTTQQAAVLAADIPVPVLAIGALIILLSSLLLGYGSAPAERNLAATLVFALVVALASVAILDLDRPQRGLIRVNLTALQEVQRSLASSAP